MPKMKTHKGLAKRLKVTATGKIKHRRAGKSHLMSGKSPKRRRHLRQPALLDNKPMVKRLKVKLGQ
ncbi:MAG: 50S ribosomal protein L35 [Sedimentisphaerales bacterium]|nr:50S ribosomal protein L35 [Sedimentisphaerales bacterium]